MSESLQSTFRFLRDTENQAAIDVLTAALDCPYEPSRLGALQTLLDRRDPEGHTEVFRRLSKFDEKAKAIIDERSDRLVRVAVNVLKDDADDKTCVAACAAIVAFRLYDALPAMVAALVNPQTVSHEPLAQAILKLTDLFYGELSGTASPAASGTVEQLQARSEELLERLTLLDDKLQQRFERRGQLAEQLKTLADDRRLADKQLDMATMEQRIRQAVTRWQVLAVTGRTLDTIRTVYEQQRQPETLQEASGYLDRLTQGRYRRVWTPLGEDVLRVDDAAGNPLAVEVLSRGTREQLFLALRLALAASYARRGATLPLVLDDVLVNFDADRAAAAATVLRDFADAGHQVLVFTCHEHIFKLFESLQVPANRLPDNAKPAPAAITFTKSKKQKARRASKKATPKPVEVVVEAEPPIDEIAAVDDGPEDESLFVEEPPQPELAELPDEVAEEEPALIEQEAGAVFDVDFFDTTESEEAPDEVDEDEDEG